MDVSILKKKHHIDDERKFLILILVITFLVSSLPVIMRAGVFYGHDIGFHLQRIKALSNELFSNQFPTRIYSDAKLSYGYGASMFYPDLFLYVPAFLVKLGVSIFTSYKIFVLLFQAIGITISFYKIAKCGWVGMLCTILYNLSVYRMLDIYTRAAIGEWLALLFFPLMISALLDICRQNTKNSWWLLSLAYTGILQSHILSFVIALFIGLGFVVCNLRIFIKAKILFSLLKSVFFAILINLWFIIPFLDVYKLDVMAKHPSETLFMSTKTSLIALLDVSLNTNANYGTVKYGIGNCMIQTVGLPILLGCVSLIAVIFVNGKKHLIEIPKFVIASLVVSIISIWTLTDFFPWGIITKIEPLKSFILSFQFIWRFNIVLNLFGSIAAAYGYIHIANYFLEVCSIKKVVVLVTILCCFVALTYTTNFMRTQTYVSEESVLINSMYFDDLYLLKNNTIATRERYTHTHTHSLGILLILFL